MSEEAQKVSAANPLELLPSQLDFGPEGFNHRIHDPGVRKLPIEGAHGLIPAHLAETARLLFLPLLLRALWGRHVPIDASRDKELHYSGAFSILNKRAHFNFCKCMFNISSFWYPIMLILAFKLWLFGFIFNMFRLFLF